jgi:hypothetical protein
MNYFSTTKILQVVQGRDTYKPDDVYILRYDEQRGSLNKISFKELHFWGWFCFRPSLAQLSASPPVGQSSSPHLQHSMMPICEFGGTLTVAGKASRISSRSSKTLMETRPSRGHKFTTFWGRLKRVNQLRISDIPTPRGRREPRPLLPMPLPILRKTGE